MSFKKRLGKRLLNFAIKGTVVGQEMLHVADGYLEQLRIELELRHRINTFADLKEVMKQHGWVVKESSGNYIDREVVDKFVATFDIEGTGPHGKPEIIMQISDGYMPAEPHGIVLCEECHYEIPRNEDGLLMNDHHGEDCSRYEDPVSMNSGC